MTKKIKPIKKVKTVKPVKEVKEEVLEVVEEVVEEIKEPEFAKGLYNKKQFNVEKVIVNGTPVNLVSLIDGSTEYCSDEELKARTTG